MLVVPRNAQDMYQGTPQSPRRPAEQKKKGLADPLVYGDPSFLLAFGLGWRPWDFFRPLSGAARPYLSSPKAAVYSDFAPMGAASSNEVVAEKLREMGEGAAQRP